MCNAKQSNNLTLFNRQTLKDNIFDNTYIESTLTDFAVLFKLNFSDRYILSDTGALQISCTPRLSQAGPGDHYLLYSTLVAYVFYVWALKCPLH